MTPFRRTLGGLALVLAALAGPNPMLAQAPMPAVTAGDHLARLDADDIRTWLTFLSSDMLQGRGVFTEGYGLASSYVAEELGKIGVTPLGTDGTYFQPFARSTFRVTTHSKLALRVAGETREFAHGDHVAFTSGAGSRTLRFSRIVFAGHGLSLDDDPIGALDLSGALVLYMPDLSEVGGLRSTGRQDFVRARSALLMEEKGAAAVVAWVPDGGRGQGPESGQEVTTFTTVEPIESLRRPLLTADDTFFAFALSHAPTGFDALQARARRGDPLPVFDVDAASGTMDLDAAWDVQRTELTQNVVGMVEGTDPALRDTYVLFGAHLDHVGYATGSQPEGRTNVPVEEDRIWNGADDDGSGSSALLAMAKAFVTGPRPRRSVVFVWHAGEEAGLLGSSYMASHPVVPLDRIQVELNVDMIGRNRDNDPDEANTVYVIGADRISTDLHNTIVDVNAAQDPPLTLDYEFNDPDDPNRFYVRSDHFSYASRGIPVAFFFTGEHPDYHANTDTVDKILFPKLTRIAQLIYETGFHIANDVAPLVRDHRGARSGRGFSGRLE